MKEKLLLIKDFITTDNFVAGFVAGFIAGALHHYFGL